MAKSNFDAQKELAKAVKHFWATRGKQADSQGSKTGLKDAGARSAVTGGKHADGFVELIAAIVRNAGLKEFDIRHAEKKPRTLPGYFRPSKEWDLVVVQGTSLVAAVEVKSQVGSFGNNFNNRAEEAIGTAHDFWTANREGAFGQESRPFVGWLMLVEDAAASRAVVKEKSPHFPVFKEFQGVSYLKRYDLLCQRLMKEQLYTTAALIASPRVSDQAGAHAPMSDMTSFKTFVASLAGHIAGEAARLA